MATVTEKRTIDKTAFRPIAKGEPEWLYRMRDRAWEAYQDIPLPSQVDHLWKYTRPKWFLPKSPAEKFEVMPVVSQIEESRMAPLKPDFAAFGCNHGEQVTYTQLSEESREKGVIFLDLMTAIKQHGDLVEKYLGKLIGADFGKFEALNTALWNSGMFLYIPDNVTLDKPIYMHRHPNDKYNMPRLLVVAGENSRATIIDEYAGKGTGQRIGANSVVELFAGQASNIRFVSPQNVPDDASSYVTHRARIEQEAQLYTLFVSLGGDVSKYNLGTILNGRGAHSQMLGILFGSNKQHFDHHTLHHHVSGDTYSNIDFKVVLKDKALSAYTGLIKIEEHTQNCEAFQENRNLLLNRGTRAESIPELEILNDQVKCSHGATVGPIDPEMVFYLRSRGFSYDDAVRAIVIGFIEPLFRQVPDDLRQMMHNLVEFKLNNGTSV